MHIGEGQAVAITKVHNVGRKDAPKLGAKNGLEVQVVDVELGRRSRVHRDVGQRAVRPAGRRCAPWHAGTLGTCEAKAAPKNRAASAADERRFAAWKRRGGPRCRVDLRPSIVAGRGVVVIMAARRGASTEGTSARGEGSTGTRRNETATKRSKGPRLGGHPQCPPRRKREVGASPQQKNETKQRQSRKRYRAMAALLEDWLPKAHGFRDLKGESKERLMDLALKVLQRCAVHSATPRWSKHGGASRRVWQP